ncbi:hypothetical protein RND71_000925 [Anisodus tanguticus]|uniref:Uncharacterized protein n=1 Tax=Anisodus tanguticus TaxID=243964 RepID=A0AAE1SWW8_9SOLA|nr:hypothetical protein RND71_000925 [Anisodus tanguticus]
MLSLALALRSGDGESELRRDLRRWLVDVAAPSSIKNPNVVVIILASSCKHFCSGVDLQTLSDVFKETYVADCGRKVMDLALSGHRFNSSEAKNLGLVLYMGVYGAKDLGLVVYMGVHGLGAPSSIKNPHVVVYHPHQFRQELLLRRRPPNTIRRLQRNLRRRLRPQSDGFGFHWSQVLVYMGVYGAKDLGLVVYIDVYGSWCC